MNNDTFGKYGLNRTAGIPAPLVSGSNIVINEALNSLSAALTKSSWTKYRSAKKCFDYFLSENRIIEVWPIDAPTTRGFIAWATRVRGLSAATTKEYLSALKFWHIAQGLDPRGLEDATARKMLEGAKNLEWSRIVRKPSRRSMSLPLLKLLGLEIGRSSFSKLEKAAAWAAATTAFQGSLRMGEILSEQDLIYDQQSVLRQMDVKACEGFFTLHVRSPKVNSTGGDFIEIFPTFSFICPVEALSTLLIELRSSNLLQPEMPIMRVSKERFLSMSRMNFILKTTLGKHFDLSRHPISCHSFRAGIPSMVQRVGGSEDFSLERWGRWRSSACEAYKKATRRERRTNFDKIKHYFL